MNSQQDTTPVTVSLVILVSPNDWDEWIEVIKLKANNNRLWQYVDPFIPIDDLLTLEELVQASAKDINIQGKTLLLELNKDKKGELCILQNNHRDNVKLYRK